MYMIKEMHKAAELIIILCGMRICGLYEGAVWPRYINSIKLASTAVKSVKFTTTYSN